MCFHYTGGYLEIVAPIRQRHTNVYVSVIRKYLVDPVYNSLLCQDLVAFRSLGKLSFPWCDAMGPYASRAEALPTMRQVISKWIL